MEEMEKTIEYPQIAEELVRMRNEDQDMRKTWSETGEWDKSVDDRNTKRLKEIVEEIGWPTVSTVGKEASDAAWLLGQHADKDVEFQEMCLELMQTAAEGEVEKSCIAYLTDRVRVNKGRPQLYGTQFTIYDNGEFGPRPIEDIKNLDARRKGMGIETLFNEYKKTMEDSNRQTQERIKNK